MKVKLIIMASLIAGVVIAANASAAVLVYDLANDWSDSSNPNAPWTYGTLSPAGVFTAFPIHTNTYINVGPLAFSGNQPAWTNQVTTGNNGSPEGLAKSLGVSLFDFPLDRVGGHTPLNGYLAVRWSAPQSGNVSLAGDVWMWRDSGRHQGLSLFINGVPLFNDAAIPTRASSTTSSNPFLLTDAILLAGGSSTQLSDIAVNAGDNITLAARKFDTEDFIGFDFKVYLTPVPIPASLVMLLTGLLCLVPLGRRIVPSSLS